MPRRFCLDCTALVEAPASRCGLHQREYESEREVKNPGRLRYKEKAYRDMPKPFGLVCALRLSVCTHWATGWDHIVPVSKGGTNATSNLRPACGPCNSSKGNRAR